MRPTTELTAPPLNKRVVQSDLKLPKGVTLSQTGLVLPENLKMVEWEALGNALAHQADKLQWARGDWWHFGHKYGARAATVANGLFGYTYGTLAVYGSVARNVRPLIRIKDLSFSHHQLIAGYSEKEQKEWLALAVKHDWTVKQMKQSLREHGHGDGPLPEPMTDAEMARAWASDVLSQIKTMEWQVLGFEITLQHGQHLSVDTIAKLVDGTEELAAVTSKIAKLDREYQQRRMNGTLPQVESRWEFSQYRGRWWRGRARKKDDDGVVELKDSHDEEGNRTLRWELPDGQVVSEEQLKRWRARRRSDMEEVAEADAPGMYKGHEDNDKNE
jgi:hypothetical protein